MQIAFKLDPVTLGKIKRSAIIAFGGFALAVIPQVVPNVISALSAHPMLATGLGAFAPFVVNCIKEWVSGAEQSSLGSGKP